MIKETGANFNIRFIPELFRRVKDFPGFLFSFCGTLRTTKRKWNEGDYPKLKFFENKKEELDIISSIHVLPAASL